MHEIEFDFGLARCLADKHEPSVSLTTGKTNRGASLIRTITARDLIAIVSTKDYGFREEGEKNNFHCQPSKATSRNRRTDDLVFRVFDAARPAPKTSFYQSDAIYPSR